MTSDQALARLMAIHTRIQWIANEEARSVWLASGLAKNGYFMPERTRLIEEAEKILDRLEGKDA